MNNGKTWDEVFEILSRLRELREQQIRLSTELTNVAFEILKLKDEFPTIFEFAAKTVVENSPDTPTSNSCPDSRRTLPPEDFLFRVLEIWKGREGEAFSHSELSKILKSNNDADEHFLSSALEELSLRGRVSRSPSTREWSLSSRRCSQNISPPDSFDPPVEETRMAEEDADYFENTGILRENLVLLALEKCGKNERSVFQIRQSLRRTFPRKLDKLKKIDVANCLEVLARAKLVERSGIGSWKLAGGENSNV